MIYYGSCTLSDRVHFAHFIPVGNLIDNLQALSESDPNDSCNLAYISPILHALHGTDGGTQQDSLSRLVPNSFNVLTIYKLGWFRSYYIFILNIFRFSVTIATYYGTL